MIPEPGGVSNILYSFRCSVTYRLSSRRCEARSAAAISVGLRGECFVSPHLPSTEIALSPGLLAKTGRFEIALSPGLLAKTVGAMLRLFQLARKDRIGFPRLLRFARNDISRTTCLFL